MSVHVAGRELHPDPRRAWRAIRLEVATTPRPLKLWIGFLMILCLLGGIGALLSLPPGWEVLGTSPSFEWGILITAYVFFAITTSGLCLASSLGTVFGIERFLPLEKRHAILAVLCLVTAFGIIALDLHYPVRLVFGAVLSPSPFSPMWWMGVFYGIYLVFLLTEVWSMFTAHWRVHRVACTLSSITAVVAPMTLGAVFGVLASRPFWHGAFTPPFMLVSAFLSGTALLGIVFYAVQRFRLADFERATRLAIPALRLLLTIALSVASLLLAVQVIVGLYGTVPGLADATRALLVGPLAPWFWIIRVFLGLVLPLILLVAPRTRTPVGLFGASCLAFVGLFADRMVFVNAGQISPVTVSSGVVSDPFALYTPSLVEISIVVGAAAFVALMYTLAERYLDMSAHLGHAVADGAPVVPFAPVAPVAVAPVVAPAAPVAPVAPVASVARVVPVAAPPATAHSRASGTPPRRPVDAEGVVS